MEAHLVEISATVEPGAPAVLILDQAGWHMSPKLDIPDNITLLPLPPRSPELNPVENIPLSLIALQSIAGQRDSSCRRLALKPRLHIIRQHRRPGCEAWNDLTDQPWRITSIGRREWAHEF